MSGSDRTRDRSGGAGRKRPLLARMFPLVLSPPAKREPLPASVVLGRLVQMVFIVPLLAYALGAWREIVEFRADEVADGGVRGKAALAAAERSGESPALAGVIALPPQGAKPAAATPEFGYDLFDVSANRHDVRGGLHTYVLFTSNDARAAALLDELRKPMSAMADAASDAPSGEPHIFHVPLASDSAIVGHGTTLPATPGVLTAYDYGWATGTVSRLCEREWAHARASSSCAPSELRGPYLVTMATAASALTELPASALVFDLSAYEPKEFEAFLLAYKQQARRSTIGGQDLDGFKRTLEELDAIVRTAQGDMKPATEHDVGLAFAGRSRIVTVGLGDFPS